MRERMLSAENLGRALRRVRADAGAPGVDGMTTEELVPWLREHWAAVRQALDAGTYRPSPVRRVVIPKPGGGERLLGVPTCERTARKWAGGSKGYWRVAGSQVLQVALPNSYWNRLGVKTLTATRQRLNQTA